MKAWLFFSVALLVYGFVFESTFAKDKSPTIATLGTALVAGSLCGLCGGLINYDVQSASSFFYHWFGFLYCLFLEKVAIRN